MFARNFLFSFRDPNVSKLTRFSMVLFLVLLGDGILAFWVPNHLQDHLKSPLLMGLVISFSSIVGFLADIVFPQLLKGYSVRKLILSGIFVGFAFIASLLLSVNLPVLIVFLLAMAIWGIYYELIGFGVQQFVAESLSLKMRVEGWAIIGVFRSLAYFLGPILAGWLLFRGEYQLLAVSAGLVLVGYLIYTSISGKHGAIAVIDTKHINLMRELSHWKALFPHIWPILAISLFMGIIDATFWTTGAVWTESLAESNSWGLALLPAYQMPFLIVPLMFTRLNIFKGKKALSEKLILLSGILLSLLFFDLQIPVFVIIVFASSVFLAAARPLVDAVYTDIIARMGIERKHLVGLSSSTISLAYIVGPTLSGFFASMVGEKTTIAMMGTITIVVSVFLLVNTPKKLRLPEGEIRKWED